VPRRASTTVVRLSAAAVTAALALSSAAIASTAVAHADARQSLVKVKHQITDERHHLAQLQDRAESAAERYDAGVVALAQAKRVADDRRAAASAAQRRLTAMRAQVGVLAADLYRGDYPSAAVLMDQAQDPQTFIDRAVYSAQLSRHKAAMLAALDVAEHDALVTARAAGQAVAAQRAVVARLAEAKREVDRSAREAQNVLADLRRKQQRLVHEIQVEAARAAAARRRAAAAAARRAAARARAEAQALAAQQAANRAAQQRFDSQPADPPPAPAPAPVSSGNAASVAVAWAQRELGKPYVWAAAGPDAFDCSGLVMYVYAKAGVYLPHSAAAQYGYGSHVSRGSLQPGDLVFFGSPIHHVGIYVGGGQMIEAPHTGANVRVSSVDRADYAGATRLG
jgi:cell wall-associated NlpC family hydrolase